MFAEDVESANPMRGIVLKAENSEKFESEEEGELVYF